MPTDKDITAQIGAGMAATAPKPATSAQTKTFTTGVDKAQADFNKSLANAKNTLAQAKKQGNKVVEASARALIDQLNTVVKPALAILQKAENPNAQYTGDTTTINKALGGGAPGSGPSGVVLGSGGATGGKGAYSLEQIRAYMDANNGEFPPDLNTIASGITAADLNNLVNQYESSGTGPKAGLTPSTGTLAASGGASEEKRNAFAILAETFAAYGLDDLSPVIEQYMKQDLGVEEASLQLKQTAQYKKRFAGNDTRLKAGLNVISEADYLTLEDKYSEILKSYGQAGYFGVDRKSRQEKMSQLIGSDISAVEFQDRVQTVAERVGGADPSIKEQLRSLYNITDEDLISYFLNPKESLPRLKEKVAAAEVASAASMQGLDTGVLSSEELSKYGVDLQTARKGYATIADILPTVSKLGEIYKEEGINYNQGTAEQEVFKGLASAQRKRTKLAEKEIAAFGGSSGNSLGAGALSTQYLRKNSSAGQF